jgi:hypothetical protein
MPYIDRGRRKLLLPLIGQLGSRIRDAGDLNYVVGQLTRTLAFMLGDNYDAHNSALGAVLLSGKEYYRRVIAPYEDTKIEEEGDVY